MLDFLFGRRDASRQWRRSETLTLSFSLDLAQLNGVSLGEPVETAAFLGPAEDRRRARANEYCYYSLGIGLAGDDLRDPYAVRISSWEIVFQDEERRYETFRGRVTFRGAEVNLAGMPGEQFLEQFGACYWRDQDEYETILFYEFPNREWQVEFDTAGRLKRITITDQPLLAQEAQRAAYGVTSRWPPGK